MQGGLVLQSDWCEGMSGERQRSATRRFDGWRVGHRHPTASGMAAFFQLLVASLPTHTPTPLVALHVPRNLQRGRKYLLHDSIASGMLIDPSGKSEGSGEAHIFSLVANMAIYTLDTGGYFEDSI